MNRYEFWTPSTGGLDTFSDGQQLLYYVMPSGGFRSGIAQGFAELTSEGGSDLSPYRFVFEGMEREPVEFFRKRILACIAALLMPLEGLDEHLEATVDRIMYYKEQSALPAPSREAEPIQFVADRARVVNRPELIVSE